MTTFNFFKINFFKINFIFMVALAALNFFSCAKNDERSKEVVVYTYDSFAGEWGAAPAIKEKFEKSSGLTLTFVDCGDAVQAYTKALGEKENPNADVVLGLDNNMLHKIRKDNFFEIYKPNGAENLNASLQEELGGDWLLTPYDYSYFAMIYDSESGIKKPASLEDLTSSEYKKKIILMNPETSSPGLGFLSWTVSVFGDGQELLDYWAALKENILTMTSGWSEGWGMFESGEAPLVISYTTSPAYNVEYEKNYRDQALIFDQGHIQQVEALGLAKNAPNKKGGQAFIDFMISQDAQEELLFTQWMYPANSNVELPDSYREAAPLAKTTLKTDSEKTENVLESVMTILGK